MTLPLRQKRRQETALHIQKATLELAMQNGLETVTTDEIAAASGVSTRTFFNYYANKETAAIGHPPGIGTDDKEAIRKGTGPLAADLKRVLDRHVARLAKDAGLLRMAGKVMRSNEKARGILDGLLAAQRDDLTAVVCDRVNNRQTAAALASVVSGAIGAAILLWEHEETMPLAEALDVVWHAQMEASRLLLSTTDQETRT